MTPVAMPDGWHNQRLRIETLLDQLWQETTDFMDAQQFTDAQRQQGIQQVGEQLLDRIPERTRE